MTYKPALVNIITETRYLGRSNDCLKIKQTLYVCRSFCSSHVGAGGAFHNNRPQRFTHLNNTIKKWIVQ